MSPFQTWSAILVPINVSFVSGQLGPATKHQLSPIGRISSPQLQPRPIRGQIGGTEKARCGNCSTPSRLRSSHPPRCFCQIAKITRKSEAQLAATAVQDVMRWRVQMCSMWERPVPPADACGFSGDTWAPRQMWGNTAQEQVWVGPHVWSQGKRQTVFIWLTFPQTHRHTSVHRNKQALGCSPGGPPVKRPAWHRAACVYSPPALKCLYFHQGLWEAEAMFRG